MDVTSDFQPLVVAMSVVQKKPDAPMKKALGDMRRVKSMS
jgi:hypothetical protein